MRAIQGFGKKPTGQQRGRQQNETGLDKAKGQSLQFQKRNASVCRKRRTHGEFRPADQPAMQERRTKQPIRRNAQGPVQWQPGRSNLGVAGARKHQAEQHHCRAQRRQCPAGPKFGDQFAFNRVDQHHQPHGRRQRRCKAKARGLAHQAFGQCQRMKKASCQQNCAGCRCWQSFSCQRQQAVQKCSGDCRGQAERCAES